MFSTLPHFQVVHPLERVEARARACLDLTPNASLARGATVQTHEIRISFVSPQQMLLLASVLHQARVSMQLPLPCQLSQKRNGRYLPAHPSTPPCRFPEVRAPSSIQAVPTWPPVWQAAPALLPCATCSSHLPSAPLFHQQEDEHGMRQWKIKYAVKGSPNL